MNQTYTKIEVISIIVLMVWIYTIGVVEAIIQLVFPSVYLIIEEDEWVVHPLLYKIPADSID